MQPQGQQMPQSQGATEPLDQQFAAGGGDGGANIRSPIHIDPRTGQPMENPLRDARTGEIDPNYMPIINPNKPNGSLNNPSGEGVVQIDQQAPIPASPPQTAVAAAPPPPPPPGGPNGPIPPDDKNTSFNPSEPAFENKVYNQGDISPTDKKYFDDAERNREEFRRRLQDFAANLNDAERQIYQEVFGK